MLDYPTAKAKEGGGDEEREELDDQRELLQEIRSVEEVLWFAGEVDLCVHLGNGKKGTGNRGEEERSAAQPDVEKQKYLKGRLCLRLELGHLGRELFHQGGAIEESDPLDTDHPQPNQKSWIFEDEDISGEEEDHGGAEGDAAKDVDDENFAATPLGELLCEEIQDEVESGQADEEEAQSSKTELILVFQMFRSPQITDHVPSRGQKAQDKVVNKILQMLPPSSNHGFFSC